MKRSLLLAAVGAVTICSTSALAQRAEQMAPAPGARTAVPNEATRVNTPANEPVMSLQGPPFNLRNGATPTGLQGFYDYQSNGMTRGRIWVSPTDPQKIHAVYMRADDGTDENTVRDSRKVGYSVSTDGGATWTATPSIAGEFRLGFPYIQVLNDGTVIIAAHGDPDGAGVRTILYIQSGTDFLPVELSRESVHGRSGDAGAGVIWPAFVVRPSDQTKAVVAASLSTSPGEGAAPLHILAADLGTAGAWRELGDSLLTNTSGGRNPMAVSPGGKIGIAFRIFGTLTDAGVYFAESTDGGTTFTEPVKAVGYDDTEEFMENDDVDTIRPGTSLDLVYNGEVPNIVFNAGINGFYKNQGVYHWTPEGYNRILMADTIRGLGVFEAALVKTQSNVDHIAYPSLAVGDDGKHLMIVFQAASQTSIDSSAVISEDGFNYFRLWGVGSPDGGKTWGDPFILQDFAGDGTDSASIEYPSVGDRLRSVDGEYELSMVFQARRKPGMYAFIVEDIDGDNTNGNQPADRGPFSECFQYFQRTLLDSNSFRVIPASVDQQEKLKSAIRISANHPNPASSDFTFGYQLPTSGPVKIAIFNTLGAEVLTPVDGESGFAGGYSRKLDVSTLAPGAYRIVLSQNGRSVSQPLNIVR